MISQKYINIQCTSIYTKEVATKIIATNLVIFKRSAWCKNKKFH